MEFIKLIENEKGYTYLSYSFNYRESCNNVYKSSKTVINGKNSNITGLRKYLSKPEPQIITANTYFWTPKRNSQGRRNAENYCGHKSSETKLEVRKFIRIYFPEIYEKYY